MAHVLGSNSASSGCCISLVPTFRLADLLPAGHTRVIASCSGTAELTHYQSIHQVLHTCHLTLNFESVLA